MELYPFLILMLVALAAPSQRQSTLQGSNVLSVRFPKWMTHPTLLTNIPFIPAADLGQPCDAHGHQGSCQIREKCVGMGLEMRGFCTPWKSHCCTDIRSCGGETSSRLSYFQNPSFPQPEQKPLGTCGTSINIDHNICNIRVTLEKFNIGMELEGSCSSNTFAVTAENSNTTLTLCGGKDNFQTLIQVEPRSKVTLGLLLASSGSSWRIKLSQEQCGGGIEDYVLAAKNPDSFEELDSVCGIRKRSKKPPDSRLPRRRRVKRAPSFLLGTSNWIKDYVLEEVRNRKRRKLNKQKQLAGGVVPIDRRKNIPQQFFETVTKSSMDISMVARDQLKIEPQHLNKKKLKKKRTGYKKKRFSKKSTGKKSSALSPLALLSSMARVTLGSFGGGSGKQWTDPRLNKKFSYKQLPLVTQSVFPATLGQGAKSALIQDTKNKLKQGAKPNLVHGVKSAPRLLFGTVALPGEFPWLGAVTWDGVFLCHASLITSRHALTTAHCVLRPDAHNYLSRLQVVAGENRLDVGGELGEVVVSVSLVTVHPMFQTGLTALDYDIAVVEVSRQLSWSSTVSPVCWSSAASGTRAVMASWGFTNYGAAVVPHWADLPLVPRVKCQAQLGIKLTKSQICAGPGDNQQQPCGSDNGAPLVSLGSDGSYSLVGLYSFSTDTQDKCGVSARPHVFTNINLLQPWIAKVTRTK